MIRRGDDGLEVLLGRRSRRSRFLPGNLAFPGGRLEAADGDPGDRAADAHRRCAAREVREETGLDVAVEAWLPAGERITPPLFPVRFRTLFYVASLPPGARLPDAPPTEENEWVGFRPPEDVVAAWARGEEALAPPVLAVLRGLIGERRRCRAADAATVAEHVHAVNAREEAAPRIEFVPDVRAFPVKTWTLPPATHTNVWMPCGDRCVVIDPGSDEPAEVDALLRVVRRTASDGAPPAAVVLTHHHQDHVAGVGVVARSLGVPVRAHATVLERVHEHLDGAPAETIADGEVIDLGGLALRAHLTEGHAPGHLAFEVVGRRALISGDLVSALSTMLIDPDTGDMDRYLDSLARMTDLDVRVLLPAHGPPVPVRALARVRAHRLDREARIVSFLDSGGGSLAAVARDAYADTPDAPAFLAELQTLAHLVRLERTGAAARDGDRWVAAPG
jgi:glyoxylase-like metal-dependent hydrolase (beta-lactamase superfamily II)